MIEIMLVFICVCLGLVCWRMQTQNATLVQRLQKQITILEKQLEEALLKIAELEKPDTAANGLLEKAVTGLVALGIPGLILLVAVATSGFAGAAAITSALATLGVGLGMFGGIGVLGLAVLVAGALAQYGLPSVAKQVVKGLLAKGHSSQGIRDQIHKYPKWIISRELQGKIEDVLNERE
jgi:hypothetical protein